jgi:hypothetical protein
MSGFMEVAQERNKVFAPFTSTKQIEQAAS